MYLLIPLCLVIAAVFMYQEKLENYRAAVVLKGLASLCFVIFGILAAKEGSIGRNIVIGLILGCIADIFLNLRYVFRARGKVIFLTGILIFLAGHAAYLLAVFPLTTKPLVCIIIAVVLTALLMMWIFSRIEAAMAFKIFGIFYIGAIVLLNVSAASNLLSSPSAFTGIFAAGCFLFLISDIVLILNTFGPHQKFSLRAVNLTLYYIGQILIAVSLLHL